MAETTPRIILKYEYGRPLDLLDLTASLTALGEQFRRFAGDKAVAGKAVNPRLHVARMTEGSVFAELVPYVEQIDWLIKNRDVVAGFMAQWNDILQLILSGDPRAKQIDKTTVRAANAFVEPIAKDNAAQVNMAANDGGVNIFANNITFVEAAAIQNNARRLLADDIPAEEWFENEPMILYQVRDVKGVTAGDMGIIDRYGAKPAKLTWGSDAVKAQILEHPENPFACIFFVTGKAKTAGGRVAAYHIVAMTGSTPREE